MNMPTDAFLTTSYTIVDDWYQQHVPALLAGKAGKKPLFSDSEVMTLAAKYNRDQGHSPLRLAEFSF